MAEDNNTTQQRQPKASTTAPGPYIPEALRSKIEAHHAALARKIRTFGSQHNLPQRITSGIIADLKDFLRNDYQGLNLGIADITYIGSSTTRQEWADEVGDDFALRNLFDNYGRFASLARLAQLRDETPEEFKKPAEDALVQHLRTCGPLALYEWARSLTDYDPDFINEDLLHQAQATQYVDFLVFAALRFNANAAQLQQIEPPALVKEYQQDDQRRLIVDEVISGILSAPLQFEHLLGLHDNLDQEDPAAQVENYPKITPPQPTTAATAQEIAETASTIQRRVLVLYQPNTATLAKPIEAKKDDLMAAPAVTRGLDGFKTSKPLPLSQIIATLGDNTAVSATRVTQCLQALQIIAQDKPDKIVDTGDGNEYYSYSDRSITGLARIVLGTNKPNAQELQEVGLALGFLTTLRIGHDEEREIGTRRSGGKAKTFRRRHYTQILIVPDIWTKLDHLGGQEGDPHLTLLIHRLIPTGRRTSRVVVEDGLKQTIAPPLAHKVSQAEVDLARRLFKGDQGIRFYNYLKSAGHIKEPDLMAAVFDYPGQRAAARQKAASVLEEARKKAAFANTQEEADALNEEARRQADAITRAADENIKRHKPRDRQRLYGWLQDAVDNFIILRYQVSDAKDGKTDGHGKPIKVITWYTQEDAKDE